MNTRLMKKAEPERHCEIERSDDEGRTYLCCKDSRIVWIHPSGIEVQVCPECKKWLETLESLGQPL